METVLTPRMTDEMYVAHIEKWLLSNISKDFKRKQLMTSENANLHLAFFRTKYEDRIMQIYINKRRHIHVHLRNAKNSETFYETYVPGCNVRAIPFETLQRAADDLRGFLYRDQVNNELFILTKSKPRNYN